MLTPYGTEKLNKGKKQTMDIEEFKTEELKQELLKIYDELLSRGEFKRNDELISFLYNSKR